jgi:hypothetical protein
MAEATAQTTSETTPGYVPGSDTSTSTPPAEKPAGEAAPKAAEKKPEAGKSLVGEAQKGEQEPKAAETTPKPEDIQIKLPEGVKVDEKFMGEFQGIAKELGLKSDGAQKLADLHLSFVQRMEKEFSENAAKTQDEWYKSIESDKDLGGSRLAETSQTVQKAVQKFGGDEFRKEVDAAGLGNWPPLVKFLHKVGLTMKDDSAALDEKPPSTPANDDDAFYRGLYDKTPQMFSK